MTLMQRLNPFYRNTSSSFARNRKGSAAPRPPSQAPCLHVQEAPEMCLISDAEAERRALSGIEHHLLRQALIAKSEVYEEGYRWACQAMRDGVDPQRWLLDDGAYRPFEIGAQDAMRDADTARCLV